MKKRFGFIVCILCAVFLVVGCGSMVVATVNGEKITEEQLNTRLDQIAAMYGYDLEGEQGAEMKGFLQEQVLQSLIEERVIISAAKEKNISFDSEALTQELEKFKERFPGDKEYQEFFEKNKITEEEMKNVYLKNMLIYDKLIEEVTKDITEVSTDLEKYYNENKDMYYQEEQVKARNIVVDTEEEAKEIVALLDKGEDFAKLAVEKSVDPTVKQNEGIINYFTKGASLVDEFKNAAFALEVGEYTKEPVKSVYGFHIIKLEDRKAARQLSFEEVKDDINERLLAGEKNEKFQEYVNKLMDEAEIEKNLPKPEVDKNGEGNNSDEQNNEIVPEEDDVQPAPDQELDSEQETEDVS
ncbi:MAG: peptidyl-prolyl cis-trans isomerase [Clostridia bacterium]|nr:peptidyl-prolyl cis-trans isomerase [Clostridia bacterium]MDD4048333.1 peptidyl-prolyl cis-trans isomerase [Clostridia bacterium]